jgi:glycerol-3-phosphate acyltransferase PlsY
LRFVSGTHRRALTTQTAGAAFRPVVGHVTSAGFSQTRGCGFGLGALNFFRVFFLFCVCLWCISLSLSRSLSPTLVAGFISARALARLAVEVDPGPGGSPGWKVLVRDQHSTQYRFAVLEG